MVEPCCNGCRDMINALDRRIDQRFIDSEKRHDERFVNQRDYNATHNDLQRTLTLQAKEMMSKEDAVERFDAIRTSMEDHLEDDAIVHGKIADRIVALERWPWLFALIFGVIQLVIVLWIGLRK